MDFECQAHVRTLKEWAPLTDLFNILPTKTNAIFSKEIKLTSVDVLAEFLALGTNVGIVYWFDRQLKKLQKLYCEDSNRCITSVRVVSTVDYMVACGDEAGDVTVFQVPKSHPKSLPDSLKPKEKQVERYTVSDLHKSPITALEWSKNGMKLFSGDKNGSVVLTEIDFYMHVCKSIEILNESYEVVQLSYYQQKLLVSTTFRSIICQKSDKWKVCQVGKKDRKTLGRFGGVIHRHGYKPSDVNLYCTRPGLRVWIADFEGNVQKTLLFKDLLTRDCSEVPLLNPISKSLQKSQKEPCFGTVFMFCDKFLVTHCNRLVYILDPERMTVIATVNQLRSILDVAVSGDEIFILEGERSLIRISFRPETIQNVIDRPFQDVTSAEEAVESQSVSNKFQEIGSKEFDDVIRFKPTKKSKDVMSGSATSISSDEKNTSYTTPTIMNLSTVGVLPDLRSPESIISDIEYKEKLLSDMLNLDKICIGLENEEQNTHPLTENPLKESHNEERIIVDRTPNLNKGHIGQSKAAPVINVPCDWNLQNLQLETLNRRTSSGDSLCDWEIV